MMTVDRPMASIITSLAIATRLHHNYIPYVPSWYGPTRGRGRWPPDYSMFQPLTKSEWHHAHMAITWPRPTYTSSCTSTTYTTYAVFPTSWLTLGRTEIVQLSGTYIHI